MIVTWLPLMLITPNIHGGKGDQCDADDFVTDVSNLNQEMGPYLVTMIACSEGTCSQHDEEEMVDCITVVPTYRVQLVLGQVHLFMLVFFICEPRFSLLMSESP